MQIGAERESDGVVKRGRERECVCEREEETGKEKEDGSE